MAARQPSTPEGEWADSAVVVEAEPTLEERQLAEALAVTMMTGRIELVWTLANEIVMNQAQATQGGAMTDGSKRLRGHSPTPSPMAPPSPASLGSLASLMSSVAGTGTGGGTQRQMVSAAVKAPAARAPQTPSIQSPTTPSSTGALPEGVPDLATWGQTLLTWGKHAPKQITYADLAGDVSEEGLSYRRWILARKASGSAGLKDLANYMFALAEAGELPMAEKTPAALIPGSLKPRVLRSSASESESASGYSTRTQR